MVADTLWQDTLKGEYWDKNVGPLNIQPEEYENLKKAMFDIKKNIEEAENSNE